MGNLNINRHVVVYSNQWIEALTIERLYQYSSTSIIIIQCSDHNSLIQALISNPTAPVILGLLPHESIFLLSLIYKHLPARRVLFFGRQFNYIDRQIPAYFLSGEMQYFAWEDNDIKQTHTMLINFSHKNKRCDIVRFKSHVTVQRENLVHNLNIYLSQRLSSRLSHQSSRVLMMMSQGYSSSRIARVLGINIKTVSSHKVQGLLQLNMGIRCNDIHRGIQIKQNLQRYLYLK